MSRVCLNAKLDRKRIMHINFSIHNKRFISSLPNVPNVPEVHDNFLEALNFLICASSFIAAELVCVCVLLLVGMVNIYNVAA